MSFHVQKIAQAQSDSTEIIYKIQMFMSYHTSSIGCMSLLLLGHSNTSIGFHLKRFVLHLALPQLDAATVMF